MKKMILIGALALIASIPLQAQSIVQLLSGGTNGIAALTTNANHVISVPRAGDVAIQLSFAGVSGSTSNLVLHIDRSLNSGGAGNTQWENTAFRFPVAASSTSTNTGVTNIVVGGIGYLRVHIANTNASGAMTNLHLLYSYKPGI